MVRSLIFRKFQPKKWGVCFEVVRSLRLAQTKRKCCLPLIYQFFWFLLGSTLMVQKFAPCWIQTITDVIIAYHYGFDTPTRFFYQKVSAPGTSPYPQEEMKFLTLAFSTCGHAKSEGKWNLTLRKIHVWLLEWKQKGFKRTWWVLCLWGWGVNHRKLVLSTESKK